jgi:membrane fusion protein, multidrug efflux system
MVLDDPSDFTSIIIFAALPHRLGHDDRTEDAMIGISQSARIGSRRGAISWLPSRHIIKRAAFGLALAAGIAGAAGYGYRYWTVGQYLETTDDAYVKADYTTVAPKVSGYIAEILVADNQRVTAGQVLARIDDRDLATALDQARAELAAAEAAVRNLDAQIVLQRSVVDQEKADIAATEATQTFAAQDDVRYRDLMRTGYGTVQRAQQAESTLRQTTAQLQRSRAALVAAQKKIDVLAAERASAEAQREHSRAVVHQAELNLSYATIVAPVDGTVGARTLRVGQYVQAGTQLMAVVPLNAVYVVANYKETQLTHVRAGQTVEIAVDGFPGVRLRAHVDSVAPASGLEFALLPPDNATGNFTKIVQRIPVKIALDDAALAGLLRSGMSVEPVIDTKPTVLAEQG